MVKILILTFLSILSTSLAAGGKMDCSRDALNKQPPRIKSRMEMICKRSNKLKQNNKKAWKYKNEQIQKYKNEGKLAMAKIYKKKGNPGIKHDLKDKVEWTYKTFTSRSSTYTCESYYFTKGGEELLKVRNYPCGSR
jgi:hypothetical protein